MSTEGRRGGLVLVAALAVLRAIAQGQHRWSDIAEAAGTNTSALARVMEPLIGDLGLVERVFPALISSLAFISDRAR